MNYSRSYDLKVDMLALELLETDIKFKEFDINTSIINFELVAGGKPITLEEWDKVFVSFKKANTITTSQLKVARYKSIENWINDEYQEVELQRKAKSNIFTFVLNDEIVNNFGSFVGEIILSDCKSNRLTSQSFTFLIEPSITPNERG
ncbi:BppU family phage baseplate upper protein [Clostridium perfringens]|uniref:BppU family phage baseplate upper protein n=1 Tax=Clostridium perfringens TaxID=1502 RepID=UPI00177BE02D|nr:BppU family phage baseplate upper protein [Clostridium perfringens]MDK0686855.1 BppU family phage baseplate upper protein [Clostridium perfringens]